MSLMIGIIAGTGSLPIAACNRFLNDDKPFFVISLFPEDNLSDLERAIQGKREIVVHPVYKAGMVLEEVKNRGAQKILFIGKVDKRNLFKKFKFDWLFFKLAAKLTYKGDKAIMEALVEELNQSNIEVMRQSDVLSPLFVPPGVLQGKMTPEIKTDIAFGLDLAQRMSRCDIGQTVVVKDGVILAVEAIEGTDECIKRGIALGGGDVVVCKSARPDQNKKFDLPTLGPGSLEQITRGDVRALAWQSSHTFIADKDAFISRAQELGITLVSVDQQQ